MLLDFIALAFLLFGLYRGFKKGIIMGAFSMLAFLMGIILSLKFTHYFSTFLIDQHITSSKWAPFASFILVFIFFVLAIHLIGKFIEKISSLLLLGWANHLIGAILYGFISLIVLSSFYWFINNLHIIDAKHFSNSKSYAVIAPITPWIMEHMGKIIPWIKPVFTDLQLLITAIPSK
jgi:membrane protein required for colicin V production